jgi:hypothetical protein
MLPTPSDACQGNQWRRRLTPGGDASIITPVAETTRLLKRVGHPPCGLMEGEMMRGPRETARLGAPARAGCTGRAAFSAAGFRSGEALAEPRLY